MRANKATSNAAQFAAQGISTQTIVHSGYPFCTRRTYFIRLHRDSKALSSNPLLTKAEHAKSFLTSGIIDLGFIEASVFIKRLIACKKEHAFDCAFTYPGLQELGLQADLLKVFRVKSKAFYEGAFLRAQAHLNDTGSSSPKDWTAAYQEHAGDAVDLVLIAHFPVKNISVVPIEADKALTDSFDEALLKALFVLSDEEVEQLLCADNGMDPEGLWTEASTPIDWKGSVYFGYKDGITAPLYSDKGHLRDATGNTTQHSLGEVLLGFERNSKDNPYGESLSSQRIKSVASNDLGALFKQDTLDQDFFRGSSFGVFRKMQQREEAFNHWVSLQANHQAATEPHRAAWQHWIKAKLLGRTPISSPLVAGTILSPEVTPALLVANGALTLKQPLQAPGTEAGFRAPAARDADGLGCPFASHIRRMNPRDDTVVPFIARPLLRRSMPYSVTDSEGGQEVGLSGLFLCSDITEQFEHLVGKWANGRVQGVDSDPDNRDPIIGNHQVGDAPFLIRRSEHHTDDLKLTNPNTPFVITKGTLYTWIPTTTVFNTLALYLSSQ